MLLSASDPSASEQQILWLVNRMRTSPAAELPTLLASSDPQVQYALSYFQVDRDLLAQQWATLTPAAPLAWNANLAAAATIHTQAMAAADLQSHQLVGEATPGQRVTSAGYTYSVAGENVYAYATSPAYADAAFAIDWGSGDGTVGGIQDPPGHRIEMMNPLYRDVGISFMPQLQPTRPDGSLALTGPFLCTEDFASPDPAMAPALVGTIYNDANHDGAYTPGEGLGGVTITARNAAGTYTTTSLSAGGYALTLPAGDYALSFSGTAAIPANATGNTFTLHVDTQNVLQDMETSTLVLVASSPPTGRLELVTNYPLPVGPRDVRGWAYDPDAGGNGAASINVRLDIDGVQGTPTLADGVRPDLAALGSTAHGFTLTVPPLTSGTHTLRVVAIDPVSGGEVLLGTRTVTIVGMPFGHVDIFSVSRGIQGWAYHADAGAGPVKILITLDGKSLQTLAASLSRPDLAAALGSTAHGFSVPLPTPTTPGPHRYDVWIISPDGKSATLIAAQLLTPSLPPIGYLELANGNLLAGWATDSDSPTAAVRVLLFIDGIPARTLFTTMTRPDLRAFGSGPFGFVTLTPPLAAGTHFVALYGFDDLTGAPALLSFKSLYVPPHFDRPPQGNVETLSATTLSGWAVDPDSTGPVVVEVTVDDRVVAAVYANVARQDLVGYTGSAEHGFSMTLGPNAVPPGSHTLKVLAFNTQTGALTLLGTKQITVDAPPPVIDPPPPPDSGDEGPPTP